MLEEGKELGYGDHEHLLKTCQVYQEIAQSQMGFKSSDDEEDGAPSPAAGPSGPSDPSADETLAEELDMEKEVV